jgi:hypothetical protein
MPVKTCNNCHKNFTLGVDGVVDPKTGLEMCDSCAGVRRDSQGYAYLREETYLICAKGKMVPPKYKR